MIDNDGNLTTGGVIGLVALVMAPVFLAITLLKLFFRAPLAAILGSAFCVFLVWISVLLCGAITVDINPLGQLVVFGLMLCGAAGACYAMMSADWMQQFFQWECAVLRIALARGGLLGRGFYVLVQIIPGILASLVLGSLLVVNFTSGSIQQSDLVFTLIVAGWFLISQIVVFRFHRTAHPVGQYATFTGKPSAYAEMEMSGST